MSTYTAVCEAKTKAEMQKRFSELLEVCVKKFGGTKRSHSKMQLSNVGYFAGYYDSKTRERVSRWLGAEHPIFGKMKPAAKQAYEAGCKAICRTYGTDTEARRDWEKLHRPAAGSRAGADAGRMMTPNTD